MNVKPMLTRNAGMFPHTFACAARIWLATFASLLSLGALATTMESIEFSALPGDRTEIRMQFDGAPPEPAGYTIESPARIALDLFDVRNGSTQRHHSLGAGNAREVTIVEARDRLRVIVNLTQLVPYTSWVEGNSVYLIVGAEGTEGPVSTSQAAAPAQPVAAPRAAAVSEQRVSRIADVDFKRGSGGDGHVIIRLSDRRAPVDVTSEAGRIRVHVRDTLLPEALRRRLDVTDFATPVQRIDAVQEGPHAVFTIRAAGEYEFLSYQADEVLTVNITPVRDQDAARLNGAFQYRGERLSLNFQDIQVRSVLQLIADFTNLNLVASDTVAGRITLRLQNVPWDQALDLILKTKGLDKRQVGNVLLVAPAAEIAARERLELENQRQLSGLAPLRTEFVQVRYANARALFSLFDGQSNGNNRILSERGSVIIDERTNAIIISDTADRLEDFRRVIAQLDIPVRQVLIEARIVTANADFSRDLGIRWGVAGSARVDNTPIEYGVGIPAGRGVNVDLGVAGANASRFGVGLTRRDFLLDLELSALAMEGHAEVVARPKVITSDKQTAIIEQGVDIPYQEATSSGATSTAFQKAVLSLEVTPQITPDDRIIMDLRVNQDAPGAVFNGVPSINTNSIATQVLVDNGQTLVLGGIFQTNRSLRTTKTPFFGDLPVVGAAFRRTEERDEKSELLIFVTPKIIKDTLTSR
jgi:type IV pilus assembly protein PilQ